MLYMYKGIYGVEKTNDLLKRLDTKYDNQEIWDGGRNSTSVDWDDETGLKYNPWR